MSEHDEPTYFRHILQAIDRIDEYLHNISREQFDGNHLLQDGVVHQLQIIGEASTHISSELRDTYTEIPWANIIGMRHKVSTTTSRLISM